MKFQEMKQMDIEEIKRMIEETQDRIRAVRFGIASRNLKNHQQYKKERKFLAQLKTVHAQKMKEGKTK